MRYWVLLMCATLMLSGCGQDNTPTPRGQRGERGEKGAKGERGEQGPSGVAGSNMTRVIQADQIACAKGCELKCNDLTEVLVSAICIRTGNNNLPASFAPNQAQCRQGNLIGMTALCIRK